MQKLGEGGIWGLFVPGVEEGTMYKFLIYARDGRKLYKADPLPIMRNTDRAQRPSLLISRDSTGRIPSGWKPGIKRYEQGTHGNL